MSQQTTTLYCSSKLSLIDHLANHLNSEEIHYQITGDTSTTLLGSYNPTQQRCIVVRQEDYDQAKAIIAPYIEEEE